MINSAKQKKIAWVVFIIYIALLSWLILFKFNVDLASLPQIRHINLVPFGESVIVNGKIYLSEIIYNILAFVPLGVYINMLRADWPFGKKILSILGASLLFECVQFAFGIGASDITDIIGNTLGGAMGLLLCSFLGRRLKDKTAAIINTIGIIAESICIALLVFLTAANQ